LQPLWRRDQVRLTGDDVGEDRLGGAQHRLRIDRAGDADDRVRAGVLALHVLEQVGPREALDVAPRPDHRLADRMGAEAGAVEQLVGGRQRVVLVLQVLVQDHLALALQLGLGKGAVAHDVAEHRDEAAGVAPEPRHLERRVVLVGVRIDVGAEALGVEVDLLAVALVRALERHVLDDMAEAFQSRALVMPAGAQEHSDSDCLDMRQTHRYNAQSV
jgi:hypothetical protein